MNIGALIRAISDDVVAALADASMPPLVDGKILVGRKHVDDAPSPPRVVFVPVSSQSAPLSPASGYADPKPQNRAAWLARSIFTDEVRFEVHVWGAVGPVEVEDDFDATQLLYQQVIRSAWLLLPGLVSWTGGPWVDQQSTSQPVQVGHHYQFAMTIQTPITDSDAAGAPKLRFVPPDTVAVPSVNLDGEAP